MAGRWAALPPPQTREAGFDAEQVRAVLLALDELQIALPFPLGEEWRAPTIEARDGDVVVVVQRMAQRIEAIQHPSFWNQDGEVLHGSMSTLGALAHLEGVVAECRQGIERWIREARQQLKALGLTVAAAEVQAVALRLVTTAVHLANQVAEIEAGRLPDPLPAFPPPPVRNGSHGGTGRPTFEVALERWMKLRRPAQKSQLDAAARLQELAQHTGHNRLEQLTPAEVAGWRDALLEVGTASTAKRKLAMVRAVLAAAGWRALGGGDPADHGQAAEERQQRPPAADAGDADGRGIHRLGAAAGAGAAVLRTATTGDGSPAEPLRQRPAREAAEGPGRHRGPVGGVPFLPALHRPAACGRRRRAAGDRADPGAHLPVDDGQVLQGRGSAGTAEGGDGAAPLGVGTGAFRMNGRLRPTPTGRGGSPQAGRRSRSAAPQGHGGPGPGASSPR